MRQMALRVESNACGGAARCHVVRWARHKAYLNSLRSSTSAPISTVSITSALAATGSASEPMTAAPRSCRRDTSVLAALASSATSPSAPTRAWDAAARATAGAGHSAPRDAANDVPGVTPVDPGTKAPTIGAAAQASAAAILPGTIETCPCLLGSRLRFVGSHFCQARESCLFSLSGYFVDVCQLLLFSQIFQRAFSHKLLCGPKHGRVGSAALRTLSGRRKISSSDGVGKTVGSGRRA